MLKVSFFMNLFEKETLNVKFYKKAIKELIVEVHNVRLLTRVSSGRRDPLC
jgi:uncharacterized protein YaaR (DUF327 family)